jgi:predicted ABC-type ATPase
MVTLGGINGAGKSTMAAQLKADPDLAGAQFLDPDAAALSIIRRSAAGAETRQ